MMFYDTGSGLYIITGVFRI